MLSTSRLLALCLSLPLLAGCAPAATTAPPPAAPAEHAPDHAHGGHEHGGHEHGPLVHRFEDAARWAKEFDDPARDAWQRPADVIAAMAISPGQTVADIGAGTGYFLPHLARAVGPKGTVFGLDIEPDMVRYMRERAAREGLANVQSKVVALDDPGLQAGSIDRVLIVDTWHHIDGRTAYATKLREGLAPGGAVYIVDFTKESLHGPPAHHRLSPEQVIGELTAAGLDAALVEEPLPDQFIVAGRRK